MLNKILKGTDRCSQIKLEKLNEKIGENPNIAWYPSAGNDFRNLIQVETRTSVSPDLYFHTDYWITNEQFAVGPIVYRDGVIVMDNNGESIGEIMEINYLTCTDDINYYINPDFVGFPYEVSNTPTILLIDVLVYVNGEQVRKPVLYWYFENIHFLDEVLLKFKIPITHIYKVREAYRGNGGSIAVSYAFLSGLKTQYLLIDNMVNVEFPVLDVIRDKHRLMSKNFNLHNVVEDGSFVSWNNDIVNVMIVEILDEPLTNEHFQENLNQIRNLALN
jgi:hypothetical protein